MKLAQSLDLRKQSDITDLTSGSALSLRSGISVLGRTVSVTLFRRIRLIVLALGTCIRKQMLMFQ